MQSAFVTIRLIISGSIFRDHRASSPDISRNKYQPLLLVAETNGRNRESSSYVG